MKKCSLICIKPPICYILTTKNIFWFKNIPGCVNKINAFQASQTTQGLYWSCRVWDGFLVLRIYDLVILKLPQLDWIIKFISRARIFRFLPLLSHIFPCGSHQTQWQCMSPLAWVGSAWTTWADVLVTWPLSASLSQTWSAHWNKHARHTTYFLFYLACCWVDPFKIMTSPIQFFGGMRDVMNWPFGDICL